MARHKLVDHWRRQAREERGLNALEWTKRSAPIPGRNRSTPSGPGTSSTRGPPSPGAALTLRYLDDLSVPEVAALLERTVHATEALLFRARAAFRRSYAEEETFDG